MLLVPVLGVAALPAGVQAADGYTITSTVNTKQVVLGKRVTFTGAVAPKAGGQLIHLQRRYSKKSSWSTVQTRRIAADGTFKLIDSPDRLKVRWYRVLKPKSGQRAGDATSATKVTVWRWHYLTDLDDWPTYENVEYDTVTIDGGSYKKSLLTSFGNDDAMVEFNLSRKCRTMVATYGLADTSATGAVGDVEVLGDGGTLYRHKFALGDHERSVVDTRGVLRVRFEFTQVNPDERLSTHGAVGSPRVLCRF